MLVRERKTNTCACICIKLITELLYTQAAHKFKHSSKLIFMRAYHADVVDNSAGPHRQHSDIVQASLAASLWKTLGGVNVIVKVVLRQSWFYRLIE